FILIVFILMAFTFNALLSSSYTLNSPDKKIQLIFNIRPSIKISPHQNSERDCIYYNVTYNGREVILDSQLGLELGGEAPLLTNFQFLNQSLNSVKNEWNPVYGERDVIPDNYNEMIISLQEKLKPFRILQLNFRAYNEGVAFRYFIPKQANIQKFSITRELTWFRFPDSTRGWVEYGTEEIYQKLPIRNIKNGCLWPLTVELKNGLFACVTEAALDNYSLMKFKGEKELGDCVIADLAGTVQGVPPFASPWRCIIIGERPGDLLEKNYLVLNLNPPCEIKDTSWIKPGKAIREMTLSTTGAKAYVDFAAAHGLNYIHFDAGWYGHEYDSASDATRVSVDPRRNPKNDLDLPAAIQYASERGIGVMLYVNRRALERQMDELLPLYQKWGVRGIKPGFVTVGPQEWTNWLNELVRKAAQYCLMVDVHDLFRPSGFCRTYPNFMTQEGVRGNEHRPEASNSVTLPFTRLIAGAADCTPKYFSKGNTTFAHQLTLPIVFYGPLQFLFWHEKPADFQGEPEIELWDNVPTVWDETRVLDGQIGEFIIIARRSGDSWFVGALTNQIERNLNISLNFLQPDVKYFAKIYSDDPADMTSRTKVKIQTRGVDSQTILEANLIASGGQAIWIFTEKN
ncbi:glycoside hydrolase family 97 N-terminal domain-containing protein, partial [candidate division KSB1 bacterium]|nr:glycoside hydrolase family 97 N-terminal domain-containing protein [candidate division KSB1 bacterium]